MNYYTFVYINFKKNAHFSPVPIPSISKNSYPTLFFIHLQLAAVANKFAIQTVIFINKTYFSGRVKQLHFENESFCFRTIY